MISHTLIRKLRFTAPEIATDTIGGLFSQMTFKSLKLSLGCLAVLGVILVISGPLDWGHFGYSPAYYHCLNRHFFPGGRGLVEKSSPG